MICQKEILSENVQIYCNKIPNISDYQYISGGDIKYKLEEKWPWSGKHKHINPLK